MQNPKKSHNKTIDALETLGTRLRSTDAAGRDAIHLAVMPVIAGEDLQPGESVKLQGDTALPGYGDEVIGIVDPFLRNSVYVGQRFWLVLLPRTITSLRHVWEHPGIPNEEVTAKDPQELQQPTEEELHQVRLMVGDPLAQAQEVLRDEAYRIGITEEELIQGAERFLETGNYMSSGPRFEGASVGDTFWDAYEVLKDKKVERDSRSSFFSCSC